MLPDLQLWKLRMILLWVVQPPLRIQRFPKSIVQPIDPTRAELHRSQYHHVHDWIVGPPGDRVLREGQRQGFRQQPTDPFRDRCLVLLLDPEAVVDPRQEEAFVKEKAACIVGGKLAERFGWKLGDRNNSAEKPISIYKVINFVQAKDWFSVQDDKLNTVDKIIK